MLILASLVPSYFWYARVPSGVIFLVCLGDSMRMYGPAGRWDMRGPIAAISRLHPGPSVCNRKLCIRGISGFQGVITWIVDLNLATRHCYQCAAASPSQTTVPSVCLSISLSVRMFTHFDFGTNKSRTIRHQEVEIFQQALSYLLPGWWPGKLVNFTSASFPR